MTAAPILTRSARALAATTAAVAALAATASTAAATTPLTMTVTNVAATPVTLTALSDTVNGNLNNVGSCRTGVTIAPSATYVCRVPAPPASRTPDVVTDTVTDPAGHSATASAAVELDDTQRPVRPQSVTRAPALHVPAGCVTGPFQARVTSAGAAKLTFYLNGRQIQARRIHDNAVTLTPTGGRTQHVTATLTLTSSGLSGTIALTKTVTDCR